MRASWIDQLPTQLISHPSYCCDEFFMKTPDWLLDSALISGTPPTIHKFCLLSKTYPLYFMKFILWIFEMRISGLLTWKGFDSNWVSLSRTEEGPIALKNTPIFLCIQQFQFGIFKLSYKIICKLFYCMQIFLLLFTFKYCSQVIVQLYGYLVFDQ